VRRRSSVFCILINSGNLSRGHSTKMPATRTTESLESPQVRQFSVFLQNKVGALLEVVKLLNEHNIVALALSIQDSSESSIGRMIVSDPERVTDLFHKHDIAFSECQVLVVELPGGASDLTKVLSALLMAEVNIIFSYPLLVRPRGRAVLVMHVDDSECSSSVLRGGGFKILAQADLSR
jgi:hypothetical protein